MKKLVIAALTVVALFSFTPKAHADTTFEDTAFVVTAVTCLAGQPVGCAAWLAGLYYWGVDHDAPKKPRTYAYTGGGYSSSSSNDEALEAVQDLKRDIQNYRSCVQFIDSTGFIC